jgi:hypothetical protein
VLVAMLVVSFLMVYALYATFGKDASVPGWNELIARIGPAMFVMTSMIYMVILTLAVGGWGWIIGTLSGNWQWLDHVQIYCVTTITRRIPGSVWYLLGRIVLYEQVHVPRSLTAIASGVEFATILCGSFLVAIITWPIAFSTQGINSLWFIAGLVLGGLLLNPRTLSLVIRRINPQSEALELRYCHLFGWILLYAGVWCGGGCILFILITTLQPVPWSMLPVSIGIWATAGLIATLLSFVPLGLGQELTLTALLSPYTGASEAIMIALLMRGVLTINEFAWAFIAGMLNLRRYVCIVRTERAARNLSESQ